jgi:hypothetical protein
MPLVDHDDSVLVVIDAQEGFFMRVVVVEDAVLSAEQGGG